MEFKGTKGEWKTSTEYPNMILTDSGAYRPNAMMLSVSSKTEMEANAKLIAAAPELLRALQGILDFPKEDLDEWRKEGNMQITLNAYHINKALEAIEKALK